MKSIAYCFDLDGTLIEIDEEKAKKTKYNELCFKNYGKAYKLYLKYKCKYDIYIITNRTYHILKDLRKLFPGVMIYVRDFYTTDEEINAVSSGKISIDDFYDKMVKFKIRILNQLSEKYNKVIYFDDMAYLFKKYKKLLNKNVIIKQV